MVLETIEEIGEENREYFMEAGGERYEYIAALNSDKEHIDVLFDIVQENLQTPSACEWLSPMRDFTPFVDHQIAGLETNRSPAVHAYEYRPGFGWLIGQT